MHWGFVCLRESTLTKPAVSKEGEGAGFGFCRGRAAKGGGGYDPRQRWDVSDTLVCSPHKSHVSPCADKRSAFSHPATLLIDLPVLFAATSGGG
ncbi:hypothetical protein SUGI_0824530 [Cryptomeria japonica]|nr:hypothetical protein SUGI_0824530 [Cryptomeria japonica]